MPDIADRPAFWRAQERTTRSFDADLEVRAGTEGDGYTFEGVASVVDKPYEVVDMFGPFTETISRGAFDKTIGPTRKKGEDIFLYRNHDTRGLAFASMLSGSMALVADPHLRVNARLNSARTDVRDTKIAVDDRLLTQMSIGFRVNKGKDTWSPDYTERTIHELWLGEVSIVAAGANPFTSGSMRSLAEMVDALTAGDTDPAEIERMISHLSGLLPAPEPKDEANPFALSEAELEAFWAKAAAIATA